MFAVFAAFVPDGEGPIKTIAFGLAVGVFVDAFVVRMTLVPAVLALLGRAAWWLPRWIDRRLPSFDVEGAGPGPPAGAGRLAGAGGRPRDLRRGSAARSGRRSRWPPGRERSWWSTARSADRAAAQPGRPDGDHRRPGQDRRAGAARAGGDGAPAYGVPGLCARARPRAVSCAAVRRAEPEIIFVDHADVLAHDDRAALASLLDDRPRTRRSCSESATGAGRWTSPHPLLAHRADRQRPSPEPPRNAPRYAHAASCLWSLLGLLLVPLVVAGGFLWATWDFDSRLEPGRGRRRQPRRAGHPGRAAGAAGPPARRRAGRRDRTRRTSAGS